MRFDARSLAQATTAGIAIAALPADTFSWPWLLALSLPAIGMLVLQRIVRRLGTLDTLALGIVVQLLAIAGAHALDGPLEQRAAIGGTLIPPLVYLALRGEELDAPRSVFLSFCVFVIGEILGSPSALHVLAFVGVAVVALQTDVRAWNTSRRACWRGPDARGLSRLRTTLVVVVASLAAFLASFQVLQHLPASDARAPATVVDARSTVGPGQRFEFGHSQGEFLDLHRDELVRVHAADGGDVPPDLYLRCGHFDVAELDRWTAEPESARPAKEWRLHPIVSGVPERLLEIEMRAADSQLAYVPAGATSFTAPDGMVGNRRSESFRFRTNPAIGLRFLVLTQSLHRLALDALSVADPSSGLLRVSPAIVARRRLFDSILDAPEMRRRVTPFEMCTGIAAVLRKRCRYELREPTGPYGHALLDFLDGDHHGYCMHFASATAICLRLAGVPCRIGVGLYGGDPVEGEPRTRTFGSRHAHAWVEIPYDGLGWVVFDPTPPAARSGLLWPGAGTGALEQDVAEGTAGRELAAPKPALTVFVALGAQLWPWLLLAVLLGAPLLLAFRTKHGGSAVSRGRTREAQAARAMLDQLLARLARAGHARHDREGLEHLTARLRAAGLDVERIADAFAAYHEVRFGGRPFDQSRRRRLKADAPDPA